MRGSERVRGDGAVAKAQHVDFTAGFTANYGEGVVGKERVRKGLRAQFGLAMPARGDGDDAAILAEFLNQPAEFLDVTVQPAVQEHQRSAAGAVGFIINFGVCDLQVVSGGGVRAIRNFSGWLLRAGSGRYEQRENRDSYDRGAILSHLKILLGRKAPNTF